MDDERRDATVLAPIVLGMDAAEGYSGADLTNPRTAVLAGEVPYLDLGGSTPDTDPVLELRIHGVGGAPATQNLQSPATVQVAGDGTAGFYRAWYPGGTATGRPRREAYCWGGLNTRATSRAFYLLLVAFMLVNIAHWALPGRRAGADAVSRALLRLLGLALTLAFFATTVTLLGDLLAWQAPAAGRGGLPTWLGWYARRDTGPRLAMSLLLTLVVLGGLMWLSITTVRNYERWGAAASSDDDPEWPLTRPSFWHGERAVNRQRNLHVIAVSGLVLMFAALPHSSVNDLRTALLAVAAAMGAVAATGISTPWADRLRIAGAAEQWPDVVCMWFARFAVAVAASTSFARIWWRVDETPHALPGDQLVQTVVVCAEFGLVVALTAAVVAQAPWRAGREVMGFGLAAPMLAALAAMVATIFGSALTLAAANLIGTPKVTTSATGVPGQTLLLPSTVYAGGVGMVVALVALLLTAGCLWWWSAREGRRLGRTGDERPADSVQAAYPEPGGAAAALSVGRIWARSSLTDHAAAALTAVTVPTTVLLVAYLLALQSGLSWGAGQRIAAIGGTIGVAATLYFLALLRSALLDASKRRRFGFVWDVGTFWPRACHPFAPPCYAERSIPEVVDRIRRITGDRVRGTSDPTRAQQDAELRGHRPDDPREQHSPVLLTGYSQGTPISIAVVAQLPQEVRARLALLTLAAPVRRLYGRTFPAYFGPDLLAKVRAHLTREDAGADGVRWRNLVRRSDYVGGWAFDPVSRPADNAAVDRLIQDPPVLWDDTDPSPPPTHRHSDLFADPQTVPYARALALALEVDVRAGRDGGSALRPYRGEQLPSAGHPDKFRG